MLQMSKQPSGRFGPESQRLPMKMICSEPSASSMKEGAHHCACQTRFA